MILRDLADCYRAKGNLAVRHSRWQDATREYQKSLDLWRALAARDPYFHNGAAATPNNAVEFYNQRFNLSLTPQQKADLVAFLQTL